MVRDHLVAGLWGFAEGTFFFVVPDVWTSWVALRRPKRALATTASALAGALLGGGVIHRWAARTPPDRSRSAMVRVPGIPGGMVDHVEGDVAANGDRVLVLGPLRGTPYKLYARASGLHGHRLLPFLGWSIPGRWPRFLLVTGGAAGAAALRRRALPELPQRVESAVFLAGWALFYAIFLPLSARRHPDADPRHDARPRHDAGVHRALPTPVVGNAAGAPLADETGDADRAGGPDPA